MLGWYLHAGMKTVFIIITLTLQQLNFNSLLHRNLLQLYIILLDCTSDVDVDINALTSSPCIEKVHVYVILGESDTECVYITFQLFSTLGQSCGSVLISEGG